MADYRGSGVFISYRRDDSRGFAGRLYDHLVQRFDSTRVFMDVDSIEPGLDFGDAIEQAVGSCSVLLALIGPQWLSAGPDGHSRVNDPDDLVAVEIGAALHRDIRVIPVLVDGAEMPRRQQLPAVLAPLVRRNAVRLDHESFLRDLDAIVTVLDRVVVDGQRRGAQNPQDPIRDPSGIHLGRQRFWEASVLRPSRGKSSVLRIMLTRGERVHAVEVVADWRTDRLFVDGTQIDSGTFLNGPRSFMLVGVPNVQGELNLQLDKNRAWGNVYSLVSVSVNGEAVPVASG